MTPYPFLFFPSLFPVWPCFSLSTLLFFRSPYFLTGVFTALLFIFCPLLGFACHLEFSCIFPSFSISCITLYIISIILTTPNLHTLSFSCCHAFQALFFPVRPLRKFAYGTYLGLHSQSVPIFHGLGLWVMVNTFPWSFVCFLFFLLQKATLLLRRLHMQKWLISILFPCFNYI